MYTGTEVLETLHPGVTVLCFIIKVWLVTLIGLTNSLSTSNFLGMIQKRHVFLMKAVNNAEIIVLTSFISMCIIKVRLP